MGLPYVWGGTGPNGYDCSGLTSGAWRSAGVNLNRTSREQYKQVLKISYDQMRPGDLVFWGSNPNNPDSITHVAVYAGNGQIVEASRPGVPLRQVAMRWSGTMPFAGRP
ncbi:C40 family peptidase [Cellulomonas sp. JZ18]|uniref:C40 family peptidase n=1 Tax=Cellulomonas sp. JZ18 TaxID=2654191 RepID=UPI00351AE745